MGQTRRPMSGVCSSVTTRAQRVRRSNSSGSLDVRGSIVARNVWLFENQTYKKPSSYDDVSVASSDSVSVDCAASCPKHTWWLTTNLQASHLCNKCNKRIGTGRAIHKCTACKGVYHLKCASELDEAARKENKMDVRDFVPLKQGSRSARHHSPCKVTTRRNRVPFSQLQVDNTDNIQAEINNNFVQDELDGPDLPIGQDVANETCVSTRSQARDKLTGMKKSFVKRCQSLKKKVKGLNFKEKVGSAENSSASQNDQPLVQEDWDSGGGVGRDSPRLGRDRDSHGVEHDSLEEERAARIKSPVLKRVRSRQAQIRAESSRRRAGPYTRSTKRRRQPVLDVDFYEIRDRLDLVEKQLSRLQQEIPSALNEWHNLARNGIRDRLDLVEKQLNRVQQEIPSAFNEWHNLARKFRSDYKEPASIRIKDEDTHPKVNEARGSQSCSSWSTSDEVYVVRETSTTSHEDPAHLTAVAHGHVTTAAGHVTTTDGHVTQAGSAGSEHNDSSLLPSGIPDRLKLDLKSADSQSFGENQTSTPVTNCELSFRSASKQYAKLHKITHRNVTTINLENSVSDKPSYKLRGGNPNVVIGETTWSSKTSSEQEHRKVISPDQGQRKVASPEQSQTKVLSPEQIAVRSFLQKRRCSSGSFSCSPTNHADLSASPVASSTFRNDWCGRQTDISPVSFTLRNDVMSESHMSFARILNESKLQETKPPGSEANSPIISELSCTFRNDSQMAAMGADENLPGYTTNVFAAQTFNPTESESETDLNVNGNRITVEADIEIDGEGRRGTVFGSSTVHEMDCAASIDGASLTNVTECSTDDVNSFIGKKPELYTRSRWINKDVFMFGCSGGIENIQSEKQGLGMSREREEQLYVNERGDGKKPPLPCKKSQAMAEAGANCLLQGTDCPDGDVDFIREAEKHLEVYKTRRQHDISPGVSIEKLQRQPCRNLDEHYVADCESDGKDSELVQNRTKEKLERRPDNATHPNIVRNNQTLVEDHCTNETHEFEEMEKQFQDESLSRGIAKSKSCTDITVLESPRNGGRYGRSVSCSNSVDGDTRSITSENARYHFLHEKGMIKISSPGLKLVTGSPSSKQRTREITDIEEEDSDLVKSGSESDINDFVINNKFSVISNSDLPSSQSGVSDLPLDDDKRKQHELESDMLDAYLETVDSNQARWDSVVNWMSRDCGEPGQQELEEELQSIVGNSGGSVTPGNNSPADDSVYYSFHGQSEELRNLLPINHAQSTEEIACDTEQNSASSHSPHEMRRMADGRVNSGVADDRVMLGSIPCHSSHETAGQGSMPGHPSYQIELSHSSEQGKVYLETTLHQKENDYKEVEEEDGDFASLMETIQHGTVGQVDRLLNSDRTISEAEIKDAVAWTLERRNYAMSRLLLNDVCRLLVAAEGDNCVDAYPAYSKGHRWEPLFIVLSKQNFQGEMDKFMDFPVYRRRYDLVSPEAAQVVNSELVRNSSLSLDDFAAVKKAIAEAKLHKKHRNVSVISACPYRSRKGGEILEKGMCVVVHCLLKSFIPFDEEPFPETLSGIPVDVREGYFQLGVKTPPGSRRNLPHGPPQAWDDSASVSDSASSECLTGSQSTSRSNSMSQSDSATSLPLVGDSRDVRSRTLVPGGGLAHTDNDGDVVMVGPSGDCEAMLDKVQAMAIDDLHIGTKSKDFNTRLLMGSCIGPRDGNGSGTLGGFVVLKDDRLAALTCAHVTEGCKHMTQPAEAELVDNKSSQRCLFGQVYNAVFDPGSMDTTGVDAASVAITDRVPRDAQFTWVRKEQIKFAGFDPQSPPKFRQGQILKLQDITPKKRHMSVLKFGAETGLTSGRLNLYGTYVRRVNKSMRLALTNKDYEFFNQLEVLSVTGCTRFFDLGDSGSLVFMPLNGSELVCIGLCIGCTSYSSCIVTPIEDVFERLKIRKFKDFTQS